MAGRRGGGTGHYPLSLSSEAPLGLQASGIKGGGVEMATGEEGEWRLRPVQ